MKVQKWDSVKVKITKIGLSNKPRPKRLKLQFIIVHIWVVVTTWEQQITNPIQTERTVTQNHCLANSVTENWRDFALPSYASVNWRIQFIQYQQNFGTRCIVRDDTVETDTSSVVSPEGKICNTSHKLRRDGYDCRPPSALLWVNLGVIALYYKIGKQCCTNRQYCNTWVISSGFSKVIENQKGFRDTFRYLIHALFHIIV